LADENKDKLKDARDKCAEVYEKFVTDDGFDNGKLDHLNEAIKHVEIVIANLDGA